MHIYILKIYLDVFTKVTLTAMKHIYIFKMYLLCLYKGYITFY